MPSTEIRITADAAMWSEDGVAVAGYTPKVHRSELKGTVLTVDSTIATTLINRGEAEATT